VTKTDTVLVKEKMFIKNKTNLLGLWKSFAVCNPAFVLQKEINHYHYAQNLCGDDKKQQIVQ